MYLQHIDRSHWRGVFNSFKAFSVSILRLYLPKKREENRWVFIGRVCYFLIAFLTFAITSGACFYVVCFASVFCYFFLSSSSVSVDASNVHLMYVLTPKGWHIHTLRFVYQNTADASGIFRSNDMYCIPSCKPHSAAPSGRTMAHPSKYG